MAGIFVPVERHFYLWTCISEVGTCRKRKVSDKKVYTVILLDIYVFITWKTEE